MGIVKGTAKQVIKRGMMIYHGNKAKYTAAKEKLDGRVQDANPASTTPGHTSSSAGTFVRPLVKEAMKGGIMLYEAGKKSIKRVKQEIDHGMTDARAAMKEPGTKTLPAVKDIARPVAKEVIKGGMVFYDRIKGMLQEVGKVGKDIVAEAKEELNAKALSGNQTVAPIGGAVKKERKRRAASVNKPSTRIRKSDV
jgi:hypothetical protein